MSASKPQSTFCKTLLKYKTLTRMSCHIFIYALSFKYVTIKLSFLIQWAPSFIFLSSAHYLLGFTSFHSELFLSIQLIPVIFFAWSLHLVLSIPLHAHTNLVSTVQLCFTLLCYSWPFYFAFYPFLSLLLSREVSYVIWQYTATVSTPCVHELCKECKSGGGSAASWQISDIH